MWLRVSLLNLLGGGRVMFLRTWVVCRTSDSVGRRLGRPGRRPPLRRQYWIRRTLRCIQPRRRGDRLASWYPFRRGEWAVVDTTRPRGVRCRSTSRDSRRSHRHTRRRRAPDHPAAASARRCPRCTRRRRRVLLSSGSQRCGQGAVSCGT